MDFNNFFENQIFSLHICLCTPKNIAFFEMWLLNANVPKICANVQLFHTVQWQGCIRTRCVSYRVVLWQGCVSDTAQLPLPKQLTTQWGYISRTGLWLRSWEGGPRLKLQIQDIPAMPADCTGGGDSRGRFGRYLQCHKWGQSDGGFCEWLLLERVGYFTRWGGHPVTMSHNKDDRSW